MSANVADKIAKLSAARRKRVEERAAELIATEMSLRDLRKARRLTQARVAKTLGITRTAFRGLRSAAICCFRRCEKRSRRWAGEVRIIAEFPDRAPVVLSELSEDEPLRKSSRRRTRRHA